MGRVDYGANAAEQTVKSDGVITPNPGGTRNCAQRSWVRCCMRKTLVTLAVLLALQGAFSGCLVVPGHRRDHDDRGEQHDDHRDHDDRGDHRDR